MGTAIRYAELKNISCRVSKQQKNALINRKIIVRCTFVI